MVQQVSIYYVERCPECRRARDSLAGLLRARGIPLRALEVESDFEARDQMIRISAQAGTPVVVVDKREIVGFDPRRLRRHLGLGAEQEIGPEHPAHA